MGWKSKLCLKKFMKNGKNYLPMFITKCLFLCVQTQLLSLLPDFFWCYISPYIILDYRHFLLSIAKWNCRDKTNCCRRWRVGSAPFRSLTCILLNKIANLFLWTMEVTDEMQNMYWFYCTLQWIIMIYTTWIFMKMWF